jgi:hypothetical protein
MDFKPKSHEKIRQLIKRGVEISNPGTVDIGDEVNINWISAKGVRIYPGCRIYGSQTLISPGCLIGYEAPVTIEDCQLGAKVELKGGFFCKSVFLEKVNMGWGAHVREGCILEEQAGGAHCVGLKQTILFPYVTLGSLINFCDCLMAGGTSRKNHSEVGSSYIHFNYTPKQDKATASLIGDVSRGVMLREPPIFLGGQGGIVGPAKIDYGTVIPAGIIYRHDREQNQKVTSLSVSPFNSQKNISGVYGTNISNKVRFNIEYIANLMALRQWYRYVRHEFFIKEENGDILYRGACAILDGTIAERIRQLNLFALNLEMSIKAGTKCLKKGLVDKALMFQKRFIHDWPRMEAYLCGTNEEKAGLKKRDLFVKITQNLANKDSSYLEAIQSLTPAQAQKGTDWLKDITDGIIAGCTGNLHASGQKEK